MTYGTGIRGLNSNRYLRCGCPTVPYCNCFRWLKPLTSAEPVTRFFLRRRDYVGEAGRICCLLDSGEIPERPTHWSSYRSEVRCNIANRDCAQLQPAIGDEKDAT
jgi:hypothetical protein